MQTHVVYSELGNYDLGGYIVTGHAKKVVFVGSKEDCEGYMTRRKEDKSRAESMHNCMYKFSIKYTRYSIGLANVTPS